MRPADLSRFVQAQDPVIGRVNQELAAGRKQTHWMWFIFPQLRGLGASDFAQFYGIADLAEARAYLAHAVLGERLRHSVQLVLAHAPSSATDILGRPDDMKLRSCLTLFREAAEGEEKGLFQQGLETFYGGAADGRTLDLLAAARAAG
ncbi:DUF1810 domain-containing protein [Alsobacter sp. SYSU M60028]|uniref:DUF1810 domain-containing protein n=1 Tax=Alsobacter ponti TaxID=2962936 RepID=A0ABT1LFU0_9HYPH|nr:DUF1810 domain-containing protein [Alsobacter ponti]MCP8940309.1 DUF1810 domain-containing protein [Alsobacter ponti]